MDKHILLVKSEVETTRSMKNRNMVSFHKRFQCCFNSTVFEKIGVYPGMYARFVDVSMTHRLIRIDIVRERPDFDKSKWYKIINPKVSKYNQYCYIRTTNLVYDFDLIPLGAFDYDFSTTAKDRVASIFIKF